MDRVGLMLRQAREERGLTLDDVARITRVPLRTLEAIEDGDRTALPAPVYVRGFVRAFARAVGVAPEDAVAAMPTLETPEGAPQRPVMDAAPESAPFELLGGGPREGGKHLALGPAILLAVGLVMFLAAWLLVGTRTSPVNETATPERPAIQQQVDGVSSFTRSDAAR